jgi:hypothetical protein
LGPELSIWEKPHLGAAFGTPLFPAASPKSVHNGKSSVCTNLLGLQVQIVVAKAYFLQKGDLRVYIELSRVGLEDEFFLSSSGNLQNKFLALCSQLHRVVVKHKVSCN